LSPPLIATDRGWLMLYHGVRVTASGSLYRVGLALLAEDEPDRCIARGAPWLFGPETPYEREGDVNNVVFPCGYTVGTDGETLNIYYGCADTAIALAQTSVGALLDWIDEFGSAPDA
ncbi:MAG TPA: glycosidase, partial [Polyangiaceae bacterium]|nr:glycosidase [Polyangiaceae bacterium]